MSHNVRELIDRRASHRAAMQTILDTADAEGRELTAEEQATFDGHKAEVSSLQSRVDNIALLAEVEDDGGAGPAAPAVVAAASLDPVKEALYAASPWLRPTPTHSELVAQRKAAALRQHGEIARGFAIG